ncbi:MAG: hypothetical protein ACHQVS_01610 [Candidatus Babeliales bacterium]
MKHILTAACVGMLLITSFNRADAHDSYLRRSLESVAASPLFDQAEKELILALPEFFTHACVKQLYFGDTEQRAIKPFVETTSVILDVFKPIKEKLAQLQEQMSTKEEKDTVSFVQYLINVLLDHAPTDYSLSNSSATRATAADIAEACRELILDALFLLRIINANVNAIAGNISAPCT